MSYRKLEVDGIAYEYSIGKTHTKIRGVGAYPNENVGKEYQAGVCHCGSSGCDYAIPMHIQVRPSDLAAFIKRNKLKVKVKTKDEKREFYENCATILGIEHAIMTRSGEEIDGIPGGSATVGILGFGLVQCFGSTVRVMSKNGTKMFKTYEEVYEYLKKVVDIADKVV